MSSGDALSASDGTQPPDASLDSFDAGPAPEPSLPGFDLPRLPDLSSLTDAVNHPDEARNSLVWSAQLAGGGAGAGVEGDDEVPTPPQWPVVSMADVPPSYATPSYATPSYATPEAAPAAPLAAFPMPAQPPTRPARPRVRDVEPSLLGLTRRSRTRVGQLAFKWVFAVIFAVILVQMIIALLTAR